MILLKMPLCVCVCENFVCKSICSTSSIHTVVRRRHARAPVVFGGRPAAMVRAGRRSIVFVEDAFKDSRIPVTSLWHHAHGQASLMSSEKVGACARKYKHEIQE